MYVYTYPISYTRRLPYLNLISKKTIQKRSETK